MSKYACVDVAGANVHPSSEESEQRSVCELEQRAEDGYDEGYFWVRDAELVQMVQMRYTKVQGRQEHDLRPREVAQHMQRHNE
jgi:hypothetical protein